MAPPSDSAPKREASASEHPSQRDSVVTVPPGFGTIRPPVVVPAIPLPYMNKKSNGAGTVDANSRADHAPASSASSKGVPVPSLEVALLKHDSAHATKNGVKDQDALKPETSFAPSSVPEQQLPVSGVDHTVTDATPATGSGLQAARSANDETANGFPSQMAANQQIAPSFTNQLRALTDRRALNDPGLVDNHYPAHPRRMHPYQHGHQMSGGVNVMPGAFDSHTPSPAPPLGGFMPPPHLAMNSEGRGPLRSNGHHHGHSNSGGFPGPIDTRFRETMYPAIDPRPFAPPPVPMETYGPGTGRYGPPTPHSFHGSHTSGEPNGMENATPQFPPTNSYLYMHQDHPGIRHPPPGPFPPLMPPSHNPRPIDVSNEEFMGGVNHIRSLFRNESLSDCSLEFVSVKLPRQSISISAHKLILARSPVLKQQILAIGKNATITVETEDVYIQTDAWLSAIQYLYLYHHALPPPFCPMPGAAGDGLEFVGDHADQFRYCLGYAAAGHFLGIPEILIRGLQVAANMLTWDTIEMALGFVLDKAVQQHFDRLLESERTSSSTLLEFHYGRETEMLLAAIVNFLVSEFPPNFQLDTSVQDIEKIARIPLGATFVAPDAARQGTPIIAKGAGKRQPSNPALLSSLKFGDLPAAGPDDATSSQPERAKSFSSVLSLILLNLPYDQLCQVLTSGNIGVSGWNKTQDRYHAVPDVVAEREERRLRAVEAVRSGAIPNAEEIQARLSSPYRYTIAEPWDVLNWREEIVQGEMPQIKRTWVPQFNVAPRSTPQAPLYDIPDSMV